MVWVDQRTSLTSIGTMTGGPNFHDYAGSMWDIYATRLDLDGNVIDTTPIVVNQDILNQGMPDVAWNGQNYLVVWSGQQGMACCSDIHMFAARVSPAGVVLDDPPIVVDTDFTGNGLYWPAVSSDGHDWAVVWRDLDEPAGIFTLDGARVAPDGTVLDPGGRRLRRDSYNSYPVDPDIVFATDQYLLVWTESSGTVRGQRLDPTLQAVGSIFTVNLYSPSDGFNPRVATDGTDFLVTYWEDRYYGWAQIFGARVSHAGQVLDPSGIEITPFSGYSNFEPSMDFDGTNYIVGYALGAFTIDLYATRVSPAGVVLDPNGIPVSTAPDRQMTSATVAAPGGGAFLVWEDAQLTGGLGRDIFRGRIGADGTVEPEACISLGTPRQTELRIAPDATGHACVFRSETSTTVRIVVQRVGESGVPVDAEPIEVAVGGPELWRPSIAWDGAEYLVVWENLDENQIYGRRLDAAGVPIDPAPLALLPGNIPDVAAVGGVFLVVSSHEPTNHIRYPKAVRVRGSDGTILGGAQTIGSSYATAPRVAEFDGRWIVVWQQNPTHDNPRANVYGAFMAADGTAQPSFLVTYDAIYAAVAPVVSVGGGVAMIGWDDNRLAPDRRDIYVRRLLPDGTFLDPEDGLRVTTAPLSQFRPAIGWDGSSFVLAFGDHRNDSSLDQHRGDLYGARVDAAGQVLDPNGFAIAAESVPEILPAVGVAGTHAMLAGSVFRPEQPLTSYRIGYRILGEGTTALGEETAPAAGRAGFLRVAPNPMRTDASVTFDLARAGRVTLDVFDVQGRAVRTLVAGQVDAGTRTVAWDGTNRAGRPVARGTYFLRLVADGRQRVEKVSRR